MITLAMYLALRPDERDEYNAGHYAGSCKLPCRQGASATYLLGHVAGRHINLSSMRDRASNELLQIERMITANEITAAVLTKLVLRGL